MRFVVEPSAIHSGTVSVPGDKSISHRALMLGAIANGDTRITGFLAGEDCLATMNALRALGVAIDSVDDDSVHRFKVYALDKRSGEILWERTAYEGVPKIKRHTKASHANSTPATDGKHVVAFFGSEGLYVYDIEGNLKWKRDLGVLDAGFFRVPEAQWEFGSSPIIHDGAVIVQCDVQEGSFLAALDLRDGSVMWKVDRRDVPTWSTPTVVETEGRKQVVVNGWKHIGSYDFRTGEELWRMAGLGDIPVPTPIFGHGVPAQV